MQKTFAGTGLDHRIETYWIEVEVQKPEI